MDNETTTSETTTDNSFAVDLAKTAAINIVAVAATFGTILVIGGVISKLEARKAKKEAAARELEEILTENNV